MRHIRRLPPFLRVVISLGLICPVSALAILVGEVISRLLVGTFPEVYRWQVISANLIMLGVVSVAVTNAYSKRFDLVPPNPLPLDSLREQARAVLLPSIAPLCAIALALIIPSESDWFWLVFPVSLLGAVGAIVTTLRLATRSRAIVW